VRDFIKQNFLFGADDDRLTETASFLETGIIDSTGILELVTFVETTYNISIQDDEMLPENLDSLGAIGQFVGRKIGNTP
jgi:acyl carrier protein